MSHGLGMTKHPLSWSLRNVARFSARLGMMALSSYFLLLPAAGKSTRLSEGFGGVGWTGCRACASRKSWGAGPMALQGGLAMPSFADQAANRRKFLQYLAASPLFVAGGLEAFAGEGPVPGTKLPDPLMWAPMRTDELIKSPKDAINVFDFEPVARK